MKKNYVLTGYGINKKGKPYTRMVGFREGVKEETKEPFGFLDENDVMYLPQIVTPIGKIITTQTTVELDGFDDFDDKPTK